MAGVQAVPTDVGGWSPIIGPNHQTLATTSRSVRCDVMCCRTVQDIVFPGYITRYDGKIIITIYYLDRDQCSARSCLLYLSSPVLKRFPYMQHRASCKVKVLLPITCECNVCAVLFLCLAMSLVCFQSVRNPYLDSLLITII